MTDLSTATIFITGATSGFGAAVGPPFRQGWGAAGPGRPPRRPPAKPCKDELGGAGPRAGPGRARPRSGGRRPSPRCPRNSPTIDVLVNNAGLALGLDMAPKADLDDWDTMVDTNIKGLMYCTRAVLPGMVERKRGHIINIGSVAGTYPYPGGNVYGGTKAFVEQFSLNLRAELLGTKVRVTNIAPGMCETEFSMVRFKGDTAKAAEQLCRHAAAVGRRHRPMHPLGRRLAGACQHQRCWR